MREKLYDALDEKRNGQTPRISHGSGQAHPFSLSITIVQNGRPTGCLRQLERSASFADDFVRFQRHETEPHVRPRVVPHLGRHGGHVSQLRRYFSGEQFPPIALPPSRFLGGRFAL
jgi:hypothetical protein